LTHDNGAQPHMTLCTQIWNCCVNSRHLSQPSLTFPHMAITTRTHFSPLTFMLRQCLLPTATTHRLTPSHTQPPNPSPPHVQNVCYEPNTPRSSTTYRSINRRSNRCCCVLAREQNFWIIDCRRCVMNVGGISAKHGRWSLACQMTCSH
jgi:hypothetical protein